MWRDLSLRVKEAASTCAGWLWMCWINSQWRTSDKGVSFGLVVVRGLLAYASIMLNFARGLGDRDIELSGLIKVGILRAKEWLFASQEALSAVEVVITGYHTLCHFGSSVFIFKSLAWISVARWNWRVLGVFARINHRDCSCRERRNPQSLRMLWRCECWRSLGCLTALSVLQSCLLCIPGSVMFRGRFKVSNPLKDFRQFDSFSLEKEDLSCKGTTFYIWTCIVLCSSLSYVSVCPQRSWILY
jgi:hypothetical protein